MIIELLEDGFFAAIAAVGFSSVSNPPRRAYAYCAAIAAVGHSVRYLLTSLPFLHLHIIPASTLAAFTIGILAVFCSPRAKCPAETCLFPALLPMIPGMYAYRTIVALLLCLYHSQEKAFTHYFYLLTYNGLTCAFIVLGLVAGATLPLSLFKRISYQATR